MINMPQVLQYLEVRENDALLDVGCGSGFILTHTAFNVRPLSSRDSCG